MQHCYMANSVVTPRKDSVSNLNSGFVRILHTLNPSASPSGKSRFKSLLCTLVLLLSLAGFQLSAQSTYTWNTGNGDYQVAANWTPSRSAPATTDILVFSPAGTAIITNVPTQTIGKFQVTSGTVVLRPQTLGNRILTISAVATDAITVASGATLQIEGLDEATDRTLTMTTANTAGLEANISGTVRATVHNAQATAFGVFTRGGTSATLRFNAGSTYEHNTGAAGAVTIPTAVWNTTSTCLVNGMTTTAIAGTNQNFGNFTWDCSGQTTPQNLNWGGITISGNVNIRRTNSSNVAFAATTAAVTIQGNILLEGGTLSMNNSATTTVTTLSLQGNFTQNQDVATSVFQRGTSTGVNVFNFTNAGVNRTYLRTAGTYTNTGMSFGVAVGAILTLGTSIDIATGCVFTNSGTFIMGTNQVTGLGTFTLTNAAATTLSLGDPLGITTAGAGNIQTATRTSLAAATLANFIYTSTGAAATGNALPATVANLTVSLATGASVLALTNAALAITSTLTLNQGILSLGGNSLTLSNTGLTAIAGNTPSATNMIVADGAGYLIKNFPASLSPAFTFPIGDNTGTAEYSPVTIQITSPASSVGLIRVRLTDGVPAASTAPYLSRYYTFETTITGYTYNMSFNYPGIDVTGGPESGVKFARYDGSNWFSYSSLASGGSMAVYSSLSAANAPLTNTNIYGGNGAFTAGTYYRSTGNGDWASVSTWETDTDPTFSAPNPAGAVPTNANSVYIEVRTGHTVTLSGAAPTFLISELFVNGTLRNQTTGTPVFTVATAININNGGTYQHDRDGGAFPNMNWNTGSTCLVTGTTATAPTNLAQAYHHFTWNSAAQTVGVSMAYPATPLYTIRGNFTVTNTNAGNLQLGTVATTLTINGNLSVSGGILYLVAGSVIQNINLLGNATVNPGGTLFFGTGTGYTNLNLIGNFTNNGVVNSANSTAGQIIFNKTTAGSQVVSGSGIWIGGVPGGFRNFTLNNSGGSSPAVDLQCNLILENGLYLLNGTLGSTNASALTLGNGVTSQVLTINIGNVGGTAPGGSILPALNVSHNVDQMTLTMNYYNLSPAAGYTTGKEMPSGSANPPLAGVATIANTNSAGVTLGNDATVFSLTQSANTIFHLNGNNLRLRGNLTSVVAPGGLNSSVAGSKLTAIGVVQQAFNYGNQTFSSILTRPDLDVYNSAAGSSGGVYNNSAGYVRNVTVFPGSFWYVYDTPGFFFVSGNVVNNGTVFSDITRTSNYLTFDGTTQQTVSGTGTWEITGAGGGTNRFFGFQVNNSSGISPAVRLNQSLSIRNTLFLLNGSLGTSNGSTLTIGTGEFQTFNLNIGNAAVTAPGGSIHSSLNVNHNLANYTFNANYYSLNPSAAYTTGKELPGLAATAPIGGTVTFHNLNAGGVTLADDVTAFNVTINNLVTLHLNGNTLRMAGTFTNSSTAINTGGLNSSVAGSKLLFIGNAQQNITLNNQVFSTTMTRPDLEISNSFFNGTTTSGATIAAGSTVGGYVNDVVVNSGAYLQINNATTLNVFGNVSNNGTIYASGANTTALFAFNGTTVQTVSGTGNWAQIVTYPATGVFPGIAINNSSGTTPNVLFEQNLALQNQLLLWRGQLGGTGSLTLGNATPNIFTMNHGNSAAVGYPAVIPPGGSISSGKTVNYNLANHTFNGNYFNLIPAGGFTTGKELPSLSTTAPQAGTVTILNTNAAGITLGISARVFSFTVNSGATLLLNGNTLRMNGTFTNSAVAANTGLNSAAGSRLWFNGTVNQGINLGNQTFSAVITRPDLEISNTFFANTVASGAQITGATAAGTNIRHLIVNSGSYFNALGAFVGLSVTGDITNNGTIFSSGIATPTANQYQIFMNGTAQQTISGTGQWMQVVTNAGSGVFPGFTINNTSGSSPAVRLNQSLAVANWMNLINGSLGTSNGSTLILGNGTVSTLTVNRSFGSLTIPTSHNLPGVTYNLNYNTTAAATPINTGAEMPPLANLDYKFGTVTINNTTANGGVVMSQSSSVNAFSMPTGTLFNVGANTLRIYGAHTLTGTATMNLSNPAAKLLFNGVAAQTMAGTMAANYTSNFVANLEIDNQVSVTLPYVQIGNASNNGALTMTRGIVTLANANPALDLFGTVSSNPTATLSSGGTTTGIRFRGSAGNAGEIYLTNYLTGGPAQTIGTLDVNITGANPQVRIHGSLGIGTTFIMTSGVVNMGAYAVNYTATTTTPMLIANQNSSSYFAFNGTSSGLAWAMGATAAGTYRWNIGYAVGSWRPITIQTTAASVGATVRLGYHGPINGSGYSATDISSSDTRSNYIATLNLVGSLGASAPHITMEYQNGDFNTAPSAASAVNLWYYNMPSGSGTSIWTSLAPQTTNGTNGSNTTIVKNSALVLNSSRVVPFVLAETITDPGTATNTFIWTGTTSTVWTVATNWAAPNNAFTVGNHPGAGTNSGVNVIIPGVTNQPTATSLTLSLNDITIGSGAVLTMATGGTLTIAGNFYNNNWNGTSNGFTAAALHQTTYTGTSKLVAPGNYGLLSITGTTTPILSPVGTIAISGAGTPFTPGAVVPTITNSTIQFTGATQTIPAFAHFNNLLVGPTAGGTAHTLGGAITVAGDMTLNTTTFNDGGFQITGPGIASGKTFNILPKGTARTYNATFAGALAIPQFQFYDIYGTDAVNNTLNLNGNNAGVQTIPVAEYGNVAITNGGTNAKVLAGNTTVRGNLTVTTGGLSIGNNTLSLFRGLTNNAVTPANASITTGASGKILLTGGISAHAIAAATTGTVTFGNIELNDATVTTMTNTALTTGISNIGNLTVTAGTFTVNGHTTSWNASGNVSVAAPATLNFAAGTNARTIAGDVIVNGTWNEAAAAVFTIGGHLENNGVYTASTGVHTFTGAAREFRGTNFIAIPAFALNGTYTNNLLGSMTTANGGLTYVPQGGLRITTSAIGAGTLTQGTGGTLLALTPTSVFAPTLVANTANNTVAHTNGGGPTNIKPTIYHNLHLAPTASGTVINLNSGTTTINNNFLITPPPAGSVTFQDGGFTLVGPGTGAGTFSVTNPNTVTINLTSTSANPFPVFQTYDLHKAYTGGGTISNTSVNLNTAGIVAQNIPANYIFGNLTLGTGGGTKTALGNFTVRGNFAVNSGSQVFNDNNFTATVNGSVTMIPTNGHSGTGKILLTGGDQPHSIGGAGRFQNLELDDNQGAVSANTAWGVNGNLGLTRGMLRLTPIAITLNGTISYPAPGTGTFGGNVAVNSTASLSITGTGTLGELRFHPDFQNIGTLTLNRTATGIVTLGSNLLLNTTLTQTSGLLRLGNNHLTFNTAATSTGTISATNMVVTNGSGEVRKIFNTATTAAFIFPVGEETGTAENSTAVLTNFTAFGSPRTIGVRVIDAIHPQMNIPAPAQVNYASRYWSFSDNGAGTGYTYTALTLNYPAADQVNIISPANTQINRYDNELPTPRWHALQPTTTMTSTQAVATGVFSQLSGTLGNNDFTIRNNPAQTYTWQPTAGSEDWTVPTNWDPARNSPAISDILLFNQGGSSVAYNVPTQTIAQFLVSNNTNITLRAATITAGNTLSISGAAAATNLSVGNGSTLQISDASAVGPMTLNFVTTTGQLADISGNLIVNFNGTYTPTNSTTTFASTSTYQHARDAGTIPGGTVSPTIVTWNAGSTMNITGVTSTISIPAAFGAAYGNIIWNSPGSGTISAVASLNGNLTISQGTLIFPNGNINMNGSAAPLLAGNVVNNGILNTAAGTSSALVMQGTNGAQTISGTGIWNAAFNGTLQNLTVNNASGVTLNNSFALRTGLILTNGVLNTSNASTLTFGAGAALTTTRTNGSIGGALNTAFNLAGITYNVNYNAAAAQIVSGKELPPTSYTDYRFGTLTINNTTGGARLGANANIAGLSIAAAGVLFDLDGRTLGLSTTYANAGTGANGLIANASGSTMHFYGNVAQSFAPGVYQGSLISNMEVSNTFSTGLSLTAAVNVGALTVNASGTLTLNGQTISAAANVTNNGILNSAAAASRLTLNGAVAQTVSGSGVWTTGTAGRLNNFTVNNTSGSSPAVNFNVNAAIQTELYLQNGQLSGTGTLTEGIGSGTFTLLRHAGSMAGSFVPNFNLTGVTYNANYGNNLAPITITMGNEFPYAPTYTINNFTGLFNATGGRVILTDSVTTNATGILSLTNTILDLDAYSFRVNNTATGAITGTFSGTNMVVADDPGPGRLRRATLGAVSYTWPVGDFNGSSSPFTHYSPVLLVFATNATQRTIGVRVINSAHPSNTVNGPQTDFVNRYWTFSDDQDGVGTYTFTAAANQFRFDYSTSAATDVNGNTANYRINRWTGSNWLQLGSTVLAPGVYTNVAYNNSSARLTGDYTLRNNPYTEYTWLPTTGTEDWNVATNWDPARFAPFPTDVLNFTEGGSSTATNVPTESVGRIFVSNATTINLESTTIPSAGAKTLTIGNNASPDTLVTVSPGSTLKLGSTGANQISMAFTTHTSTAKANIRGTIDVDANTALNNTLNFTNLTAAQNTVTGTINNNGGVVTSTSGTTTMGATAVYNHARDGGAVMGATWNVASLCNVIGVTSTVPTVASFAQTFGNFTWNSPGQNAAINLGGNLATVNGNLTVSGTGTPTAFPLQLTATTLTLNVGGNMNINGGSNLVVSTQGSSSLSTINLTGDFNLSGAGTIFDFRSSAHSSGQEVLNILGNYNQTSGTFTRTGVPSTSGVGTLNLNGVNRSYVQSAGTVTNTTINYGVNASGAIINLNNNIDLSASRTLTVASGATLNLNTGTLSTVLGTGGGITNNGTLNLGTQIVTGTGNFNNSSATTTNLSSGDPFGLTSGTGTGATDGNIRVTGTRTYGILANYTFNGAAAQITGNGITTCNNLIINNAAGVTQENAAATSVAITVSNLLTLTAGTYQIGGAIGQLNTLTLNGPAIAGTPANLASTIHSNLSFGGTSQPISIPSSISNLNNLTLNNTNATPEITVNSNITLNSATTGLTLTNGRLLLGNNNLTVLSSLPAGISGGSSATIMVSTNGTGQLIRAIPGGIVANTDFIFPIGENTGTIEFSPVNLRFTATSALPATRLIGARVVDAQHPNDGTATDHFTRYWRFTDSEAGNGTYAYTSAGTNNLFVGLAADIVGTYGNIRPNRWDGAAWTQFTNTASTPNLAFVGGNETTAPLGEATLPEG
jgi:hypothetical protein